ncbi:MAG: FAD binding domain-containing protein [Conexivisphaera sp.]
MRPRSEIRVERPSSLSGALEHLSSREASARPVAGATDVSIMLRSGAIEEPELLDLSGLGELRYVRGAEDGQLEVGALATFSDLLGSGLVRSAAPLLAAAARSVGSPQIRNLATLAGNVCTASPAGDGILPLRVLGATIRLVSAGGARDVPIEDFLVGPHRTARRPDELVASILIGAQPPGYRWFFRKLGPRSANAISVASVAGIIGVRGGAVEDARIALGAVAPTVIRSRRAEASLVRRELTEDSMWDAALAAAEESSPISDVRGSAEYRRMAVAGLLYRALEEVARA